MKKIFKRLIEILIAIVWLLHTPLLFIMSIFICAFIDYLSVQDIICWYVTFFWRMLIGKFVDIRYDEEVQDVTR